jgi:hypothetical protein
MLDWLKAIGMCLIVYGHVAAATTIPLTPPVYLKQFGVTMFLFATAFTLARETRPAATVVFNRLFLMYLFTGCFAVVLTAATAAAGGGFALSNYLPLLGGANVFFDNFPANPTTWYVGTYLHFLLLWALVLRHVHVRPWMVAAAFVAEIPIRMLLIDAGGRYIAYMAAPNWIAVFLFGLMMGASGPVRIPQGRAWPFAAALLGGLTLSAFAWRLVPASPTFPFMTVEGAAGPLLVSATASTLYLAVTWLAFEAARRTPSPAPSPIRFVSRNSLMIFVLHMPLVLALHPWLVSLGMTYWPRVFVQLFLMVPGLGLLSEFVMAAWRPDLLREWVWRALTSPRAARVRRGVPASVIALACLLGAARPASARDQSQPPSAVFGQAPQTNRPVTLFNASVFGGDGESLIGDDGVNPGTVTRNYYVGLQSTGTYTRRHPRRLFSASAATAIRFFPATGDLITIDRSARVGLMSRLGARGTFNASQSVQYSPFHQFGQPVGAEPDPDGHSPLVNADEALTVGRTAYDLGTAIGFERSLRRGSFSVGYTGRFTIYSDPAENLTMHRAAVGYRFDLSRDIALVIGTASRFGRSGTASPRTQTQDIDLGIDYNRGLSFSRKTAVSFKTGATVVSRQGTSADPLETGRQFRVLATAGLTHTIGRYWETKVAYDRNVQFVDAFPDPFFTDGFVGRVGGPLGRRFDVRLQLEFTRGKAVDAESVQFDKTFRGGRAQARMNMTLSRFWQVYGEFYYSENHLSAGALHALPPGLIPRKYARGLRVGLNLWVPHVH